MKKLLPFVIFLSLLDTVLFGQIDEPVLENNPPSLKWYQVNTPHFRVLFPKGFEEQGQRVASTLEHIRAEEASTMGIPPRKISVILQNQSSVSNGFVSVLPRRSEFYAMPSQDYNFTGTNDWLNLLMAHEYRHIVQYQHATRGFNKLFYYLFGATTLAGMAQAAAPGWFWEGDAVATETAFTPGGRGKIPNFSLVFKTNLLEGREFNYHKQYLRSYKHNIPNEYVLGYHMISYLRKRTNDPDIWEKISGRSWSVPFIPFAFSNAIRKETGLYVTGLYKEMVKDFKRKWQNELDSLILTPFQRVNFRKKKTYTDYLYPQVMDDGGVLVMKQGIGDIQQFVLLKDGKEKKVFVPGYVNDPGMLSAVGSKIVWNEFGYHPRWAVKNYSLVKTFDRKEKKRRTVGSRRERFGSAALSPDGSKVVTVRTDTEYKTQLVVLDLASGNTLKEFPNPQNHFYSMPRWSNEGTRIAVLKTTSKGKTITIVNYETGDATDVLPIAQENTGHPVLFNDYLLFNSPVSGIDNIYALQLSANKRYQVTSSRYGAYNPAVSTDGKTLYYNDQTRDGLDVVKVPFDPSSWKPFVPKPDAIEFYKHLVEQEGHPDLFQNVPQQSFPVSKYSKLKGLFNPYAWGINVDTDLTRAAIGIFSQDVLSTTAINAGYVFDINERTGSYRAQVSYQGLFPIIDVTASIANRAVDEGNISFDRIEDEDTVRVIENLTFKWQEKTVEGGIRIPLILTNSRFNSGVTFANHVGYTSVSDFSNSIDEGGRVIPSDPGLAEYFFRNYIDRGSLFYNHFSFSAHRLMKQSRRDINSKWGQRIFINAYNTVTTLNVPGLGRRRFGDYEGKLFSFYGLLYFPGLLKHHSFWGYGAYQATGLSRASVKTGEGMNNYTFRNQIPLPRGQSVARFQEFYSLSANYSLPVWYPDIAIGPILNIQRLRASFFYDYGFGQSKLFNVNASYSSVGIEAKLDVNIMRFFPQFDIGVRYTRGLSPATTAFELLIGTFNF